MRANVLKFFACGLLALALFAVAGCDSEPAKGGVGIINAERIYEETDAGKAGVEYLNKLGDEMQKELIQLQVEVESSENKEEAQNKFQASMKNFQQRFAAEQQQVMTKVHELFTESTEAYRKQKNLDVILDYSAAVSYDPKADITDGVIELMNQKKLTFTPVTIEDDETAPASDGAAPSSNATAPASSESAPAANATQPATGGAE